jgi:hypothetical protein
MERRNAKTGKGNSKRKNEKRKEREPCCKQQQQLKEWQDYSRSVVILRRQ